MIPIQPLFYIMIKLVSNPQASHIKLGKGKLDLVLI